MRSLSTTPGGADGCVIWFYQCVKCHLLTPEGIACCPSLVRWEALASHPCILTPGKDLFAPAFGIVLRGQMGAWIPISATHWEANCLTPQAPISSSAMGPPHLCHFEMLDSLVLGVLLFSLCAHFLMILLMVLNTMYMPKILKCFSAQDLSPKP